MISTDELRELRRLLAKLHNGMALDSGETYLAAEIDKVDNLAAGMVEN